MVPEIKALRYNPNEFSLRECQRRKHCVSTTNFFIFANSSKNEKWLNAYIAGRIAGKTLLYGMKNYSVAMDVALCTRFFRTKS